MSKRKLSRGLIVDAFLLVFWIVVLLIELLFTQDIVLALAALFGVFIFSALLGRDMRRRGAE